MAQIVGLHAVGWDATVSGTITPSTYAPWLAEQFESHSYLTSSPAWSKLKHVQRIPIHLKFDLGQP